MSRLIINYCPALKRAAVISSMQDPETIQAPNKLAASTPRVNAVKRPTDSTPNSEYYANHSGVDFIGQRGDPIYAIEGGKVWISPDKLYLKITTASGATDDYYHMDKILVSSGATVKTGQQIGIMGDYGANFNPPKAFGVHLHFYHSKDGKCADAYARASQSGSGTAAGGGSSYIAGKRQTYADTDPFEYDLDKALKYHVNTSFKRGVNVRQRPGVNFPVVSSLAEGTAVEIDKRADFPDGQKWGRLKDKPWHWVCLFDPAAHADRGEWLLTD